ncbi:DUF2802 domain-containing protein [Thioalkalivibrio sp.]|uniref:DUF2802 domain-containing protein n=1 Tax=Thioalkalivibrio sp. TaxID=2093813 RepID=UPI0012D6A998|nr:DUF2802 domain-containing protein [Thioalkalivibrio sp.]TVP81618.1 MAG: DUF2802 domain-containing protein [Thioalkalivibrio sp.]
MNASMIMVTVAVFLVAVAALGLAAVIWIRVQHLQRRLATQETELLSLKGALSAICSDDMVTDHRQGELEQRLRRLADQQEQLLMRDPETGPYHHALRLAAQGASREDLVKNCGLSRGEAELLLSLNRPSGDTGG